MTVDSLKTVLLTCIFICPGFIIDGIICAFLPQAKRRESVQFLYYLLYSVLQCAICSWLYILVWNKCEDDLPILLLLFCTIVIVSSAIIGILIGLFKSKQWLRKAFRKMGAKINSSIPTAWDYYFSKLLSSYIIVTLNDDRVIYGFYGENSYTSSEPEERDIYIEKTYGISKNGEWVEDKTNLGILIHQSQIKTIEFFKGGENNGK